MARLYKKVDLQRLEELISNPALTIEEAARMCGICRNTIYANKLKLRGWAELHERAMNARKNAKPHVLKVKEAIGRGHNTRAKIHKATGILYETIDRAIIYLGGAIASDEKGGVEYFELIDG